MPCPFPRRRVHLSVVNHPFIPNSSGSCAQPCQWPLHPAGLLELHVADIRLPRDHRARLDLQAHARQVAVDRALHSTHNIQTSLFACPDGTRGAQGKLL